MTFDEAIEAYREKFGDTPTTMGVPMKLLDEKAPEILQNAVEDGEPLTDDEFLRGLGLNPLPDGALA